MPETYRKGLHIIWDMEFAQPASLVEMEQFTRLIHELISQHKLTATGEVFHSFPGGGYTGVVGLTESHLSVHTWPEYGRVCFDIFLSNYLHANEGIVEDISVRVSSYFGGSIVHIQKLSR